MTRWTAAALTGAILLISGTASAEVIWRGDYESGDLSQWDRVQAVADDRLQVLRDDARQGQFALKATVHQGDNPIGASGNRNEVAYMSLEPSGSERVYRWQTKFPADYPSVDTWQLFTQFHHIGPNGSPPVQFYVRGEEIILAVDNQEVWTMPLERDRWIDFIFRAKWSADPAVGFVELYVDDRLVLPKMMARTQFPGEENYLKQGLYRDAKVSPSASVLLDGMVIATSVDDVRSASAEEVPVPAAEPPAGQPLTAAGDSAPAPDLNLEDFEQAYSTGGCSAGTGAPLLGAGLALLALLKRRLTRSRRS